MPIGRRRAALDTFMGASANMLAASLQAILLTPWILHRAGSNLYGAWIASGEMLVWMLAFDFGIPNLLIQKIGAAHAREDHQTCGEAFTAGIVALAMMAGLLALVLCGLSPFIPGWLHLQGRDAATLSQCLVVASLATCTMLVDYGLHGLARGLQDTRLIYRFAFVGTMLGFALTAGMLAQGYGLISVALGLVVRVGVAFLGSLVFFVRRVDPRIRRACRFRRSVMRELLAATPPVFLSGVSVAVTNNSGATFAAVFIGPAAAAAFGITKKAADLARSFADMIGFASYGGFAHLHAGDDPQRTRTVYGEVHATYAAVGIALLAATIAINPSLVLTWVGPKSFAGHWTSALVALSALAGGWSYLAASLLRATGRITSGSWAVVFDGLVRLPLIALLLTPLGLPGIPLAGLVTATATGIWAHRRCVAELGPPPPASSWVVPVRLAVFGTAVLFASQVGVRGWLFCVPVGAALLAVFGLALALSDPRLRSRIPRLGRWAARAA